MDFFSHEKDMGIIVVPHCTCKLLQVSTSVFCSYWAICRCM